MLITPLIIGLVLGVVVAALTMYFMGDDRRRSCSAPKDKIRQLILPVGIAVVVSIVTWGGISLVISPDQAEPPAVQNSIRQTLPAPDNTDQSTAAAIPEQTNNQALTNPSPSSPPPAVPSAGQADAQALPAAKPISTIGPAVEHGSSAPISPATPTPATASATAPPASPPIQPQSPPAPSTAASRPAKPQTSSAPAPTARQDFGFTVILASFGVKDNADQALAKLLSAGLPAFIHPVDIDSKVYYRLMVGNFPSRADAEAYGRRIEKKGLIPGLGPFIVKPHPSASNAG